MYHILEKRANYRDSKQTTGEENVEKTYLGSNGKVLSLVCDNGYTKEHMQ